MSTEILQINTRDLIQGGVGKTEEFESPLESIHRDDLDWGPGQLMATLIRTDEGLLGDLRAERAVTLICDRCLEPFEYPLAVRSREVFREQPQDEDEWPISPTGEVDLDEPLRQISLLALPTHPLCREDCPGITNPASGTIRAEMRKKD